MAAISPLVVTPAPSSRRHLPPVGTVVAVLLALAAMVGGAYCGGEPRATSSDERGGPHGDPLVAGLQLDPLPSGAFPGWEVSSADLSLDAQRDPGRVARVIVNLTKTKGSARRDFVFSVFENEDHASRRFRETTAYEHPRMTDEQRREVEASVYRPPGLEAGCLRPAGRVANCHALAGRIVVFAVFLDGGEEEGPAVEVLRALTTHVSNLAAAVARE